MFEKLFGKGESTTGKEERLTTDLERQVLKWRVLEPGSTFAFEGNDWMIDEIHVGTSSAEEAVKNAEFYLAHKDSKLGGDYGPGSQAEREHDTVSYHAVLDPGVKRSKLIDWLVTHGATITKALEHKRVMLGDEEKEDIAA